MLTEQFWGSLDIQDRGLYFGHLSGSAMPLAWAYAESVKLCHSLQDDQVFDLPAQTCQRYLDKDTNSSFTAWRFKKKCRALPASKRLRIEGLEPARIHWSKDD